VYDHNDLMLAREQLRIALDEGDGEEIYAARRYLREVRRGQETSNPFDDED